MEPITTDLLIVETVALARAAAEGAADKLGEAAITKAGEYWGKVKGLLGFKSDPAPAHLEDTVGAAIYSKPEIRPQLQQLLQQYQQVSVNGRVGSIKVDKGSVNIVGQNSGTLRMTNNFWKD